MPSPALTVQTISTYTADAHGEEEDDDVIIVDHIQVSFSLFLIGSSFGDLSHLDLLFSPEQTVRQGVLIQLLPSS